MPKSHGERGSAAQAFTAVTQAEPDRVRELLRVLDWLAAPFGDYQPGATFRSDFRNLRIGDSKAAVQPCNRG